MNFYLSLKKKFKEIKRTLGNSLKNFKGTVMFTIHDHEFAQTVANRIVELTPKGNIDRYLSFEEYMSDKALKEQREKMYGVLA